MAKGDQEQANKDVQSARTTQNANYADYVKNVQGQNPGARPGQERQQIWDQATGYSATGGITPEAAQRLRDSGRFSSGGSGGDGGYGGGGGGGYSPSMNQSGNPYAMNGGRSAFNDLGPSSFSNNRDIDYSIAELGNAGDAQRYQDVRNQISLLNDFAVTGGVTDQDYNQINRENFYEFEKTGGYNDTQLADIRARSNQAIPSFYQNLQDQMSLNRVRSGQYNNGTFDASSAKMARATAQQGAEQQRNTEVELADRIRAGRMDASKTIAGNRLDLLKTTTPAKQAALSSAAGTSLGLADTINQGIYSSGQIALAKAKGIDDYTINVATGKDRYATVEDQIAAQERISMAGISASAASSRYATDRAMDYQQAALNSTNERYLMGQEQQGRQFGMGQLGDIYRSASGEQGQFNDDYLAGINGWAGAQNQNLGIQAGLASQQGSNQQGFGNIMSGLGSAASFFKMFGMGGAPGFNNNATGPYQGPRTPGYPGDAYSPINNPLAPQAPDNPSGGATPNPTGPQDPSAGLPPPTPGPFNQQPRMQYGYDNYWNTQAPRMNYGWA